MISPLKHIIYTIIVQLKKNRFIKDTILHCLCFIITVKIKWQQNTLTYNEVYVLI
jgi:hypothetical protein